MHGNNQLSALEAVPRAETKHGAELLVRLDAGAAVVAICGLGYVGLPLAQAIFEGSRFRVLGFDTDAQKIRQLKNKTSYIRHIGSLTIAQMTDAGRFEATSDFARITEADVILICVPTPLSKYREPDLSYVIETTRMVAERLRPGQLVVLESTTYPGTTRDVLRQVIEEGGLVDGRDVFLAFSPEREDPGNQEYSTGTIPKVVGADNDQARRLAAKFYSTFIQQVVQVSSSATAEAVKLTENIFRAVNIALVNELKIIFTAMGVDIWEVIGAAQTKPFGFMPFYPGPGLGGHCIPIDPFYLTWKAREFGLSTRFIDLAGEINTAMPSYIVEALARSLDLRHKKGLHGTNILVVGLAYKKNVDDLRESPALRLIELLEERGARVEYTDPYIECIPLTREHPRLAGRRSVDIAPATIGRQDAILIVTDHDGVDYRMIVDHAQLVLDTRNVCARHGLQMANVVKA